MKKSFLTLFLGFALILAISSNATAGLMDTLGLGSKATSMGGAFVAYSDDPFAIYYNPAGLTQIDTFTVSNGLHMAYPSIKVNNFHVEGGTWKDYSPGFPIDNQLQNKRLNDYYDISNTEKIAPAPHFATAYPLSDRIVAGFGIYAPFGAEAYWPGDTKQNPGAYNSTYGKFVRIVAAPTLAFKFSEKLSIGAGISVGATEVKSERIYYIPDEIYNKLLNQYNGALSGSKSGLKNKVYAALSVSDKKLVAEFLDTFNYSYNIGIMYKPSEKVTFGFTYRSRADMKVDGTIEFEGVPGSFGFMDNGDPIVTKVDGETQVDHPPQIQFGIRCQPSEDFSFEVDYLWTRWSIVDGFTINLTPKLLDNRSSEYYRKDWEDTSQIRFGLEWVADDYITIRAGYYFDPSPVPDDTFDFATSDVDKNVFSMGVGLNFGKLTVDTVFQYIYSPQERKNSITGLENEPLTKDFEFLYDNDLQVEALDQKVTYTASMQVWALGATLNYAF